MVTSSRMLAAVLGWGNRRPRTRLRRVGRSRPAVEVLEDRLTPSLTYTVANTSDSATDGSGTSGSLRYCMTQAMNDTSSGMDVIQFDPETFNGENSILPGSELPAITRDLTIQAPSSYLPGTVGIGPGLPIERQSVSPYMLPDFRLFDVAPGVNAVFDGLAIEGGVANDADGGGIYNQGNLTLTNCRIENNTATNSSPNGGHGGGGIWSGPSSTLTLTGCDVLNNQCTGSSDAEGGGILTLGSSATLSSTTFSGNSAPFGGGLDEQGTSNTVALTNCTFAGNSGPSGGGALQIGRQSSGNLTLKLLNCTLADNTTSTIGGALYIFGGSGASTCTVSYEDSIFANNSDSVGPQIQTFASNPPFTGVVTSLGHNLSTDGSGMTGPADQKVSRAQLQLGPLEDNGDTAGTGLIETIALLPGSAAINAGLADNVSVDARGEPRPGAAGSFDAGAYQTQGFHFSLVQGNDQSAVVTKPFSTLLQVQLLDGSQPVGGAPITFTVTAGSAEFASNSPVDTLTPGYVDAGIATASALTAGTRAGEVTVVAADGGADSVTFNLNVLPDSTTQDVSVKNVNPQVDVGGDQFINVNSAFTRLGDFVDPGDYAFTVSVNYGDGAAPQGVAYRRDSHMPNEYRFTLRHTYNQEGSFAVTVTVTDGRDGRGTATFSADVLLRYVSMEAKSEVAPGTTQTLSYQGATVTLTHDKNSPVDAFVIVAVVPPDSLATLPNSSLHIPGFAVTSYDVRILNAAPGDEAMITLSYASDSTATPVLTFFDPVTRSQELVSSPLILVNTTAHTITFVLNNASNPTLLATRGTVFSILVPIDGEFPLFSDSGLLLVRENALAGFALADELNGTSFLEDVSSSTGLSGSSSAVTGPIGTRVAGATAAGGDEGGLEAARSSDPGLLSDLPQPAQPRPSAPSAVVAPAGVGIPGTIPAPPAGGNEAPAAGPPKKSQSMNRERIAPHSPAMEPTSGREEPSHAKESFKALRDPDRQARDEWLREEAEQDARLLLAATAVLAGQGPQRRNRFGLGT